MRSIIHIGANKTASTTLQRHGFAKHPEILYLGEDSAFYEEHKKLLTSVVEDDFLHFDRHNTVALFCSYGAQAQDSERIFVYSDEDISTSRLPHEVAWRLKRLMPNAKILLVIRNQLLAVPSWYASHGSLRNVPKPYFGKPVAPADWIDFNLQFPNYAPMAGFLYHRLAQLYASAFGKENVKILLYEDLLANPTKFAKEIADFCGVSSEIFENAFHHHFERVGSPKRGWNEYNMGILRGFYAEDNSRLVEDFGIRIDDYGYPVTQRIRKVASLRSNEHGCGQGSAEGCSCFEGSSGLLSLGSSNQLEGRALSTTASGHVCDSGDHS